MPSASKPTPSSGNVFLDLGFTQEEAALLQLKTKLQAEIERIVAKKGLTPKDLAKVLDVQQPQVSDLLTGKVSKMTIDKLTKYLYRLGMSVDFQARPSRARSVSH